MLEKLQRIDLSLSSFSSYRKFFFSILTYMEEVLQQIDFLHFLYGKGDAMSPFLLGIGEKLLEIEKK